ncbi:DNA-binding response OmpR family regulator [Paenibacillus endophyticus]|uniref:DNA-binding response OmpR family regulator n=1 Tax=Paenibacillus endophyticus TaxID=1294268 RepID=A0A7W5CAD5_9BACL|nr:response regulator transcription factor [Paenibacillus endophyticus]MBB3154081.1 DNA-binding response OmpR family regulator [Paenibacillus endophyticus]
MSAKIIVADDERNITDVCRRYLEREGWTVWVAANGEEVLQLWREHRPDLMVLDLMMPKLGGIEVCDQVRQEEETPIIMLTARGEEADRLLGLTMGADDYMTKPFSPRELVLRIKNILRRTGTQAGSMVKEPGKAAAGSSGGETGQPLYFDGLSIFPLERRVMVKDVETELTAKEFDLLHLLASYPGKVYSRSQLLNRIWDVAYDGDMTTVTVHIRRLREKIEDNASDPGWIKTVWGIGYKFDSKGANA